MNKLCLTVPPQTEPERLDLWLLTQLEGVTRNAVQKLCEGGNILLMDSGKPLAKRTLLKGGERIEVNLPAPVPSAAAAQNIPLEIVYEDSDLLVINKPKGMVVHPAVGNPDGTLVNALLHHCKDELSGINGVMRPGIVHRIDKDTSGLLVVAKNDTAHNGLAQQIKAHTFTRIYEAVVYGNIKQDVGTVDAPIGRNPVQRKKMCVTTNHSRSAVTHYKVLARYPGFTHVQCTLETGRTHQIRVHMAYLGHPLAGDAVYGPKKVIGELSGQCLHARVIGFIHPLTGKYLEFSSELPQYFSAFLAKLSLSCK